MYVGAFCLFIFAEATIFVTVFAVRFLYAGTDRSPALNTPRGLVLTALFVASLPSSWVALHAIRRNRRALAMGALGATFVLGLIALIGIWVDWRTLKLPAGSRFGETYYLTTGIHAFHIVLGLLFLAALGSSLGRGNFTAEEHWPATVGVLFWWFVALMWVALFVIYFVL